MLMLMAAVALAVTSPPRGEAKAPARPAPAKACAPGMHTSMSPDLQMTSYEIMMPHAEDVMHARMRRCAAAKAAAPAPSPAPLRDSPRSP